MTTEAATVEMFVPAESRPISRFFKWWKPEYKILAAKFVAGLVDGAISGLLLAQDGPFIMGSPLITGILGGVGVTILPGLTDRVIDKCFSDDPRSAPNHLSQADMDKWSTIASFSSAYIGLAAMLFLTKDPLTPFSAVAYGIGLAMYAHTDITRKRGRPPSGPSMAG